MFPRQGVKIHEVIFSSWYIQICYGQVQCYGQGWSEFEGLLVGEWASSAKWTCGFQQQQQQGRNKSIQSKWSLLNGKEFLSCACKSLSCMHISLFLSEVSRNCYSTSILSLMSPPSLYWPESLGIFIFKLSYSYICMTYKNVHHLESVFIFTRPLH